MLQIFNGKGVVMSQANQGDTIKINYTGKFEDGTVFDSSEEKEPLEFTAGEGQMIEGVDDAVIGMSVGDTKNVEVPPEKGYGNRMEEMVVNIDRGQFPEDLTPEPGLTIQLMDQNSGKPIIATIVEVGEAEVTIDANHPLAGKNLFFDIERIE
jgi:FKBP-type peptidyl-prolyl cis-trans isomerase 2